MGRGSKEPGPRAWPLVVALALIVLLCIWADQLDRPTPASSVASNIVSDLRSMKTAVLMFSRDSWDEAVRWTALPGGATSVDAPSRYLSPYLDWPERSATRHRFEIISDDQDLLWRVGRDLSDELPSTREKLEMKARSVGLLNGDGAPYTSKDAFAYMVCWSYKGMLDARASDVIKGLEDARRAAFELYAASRDEAVAWDAILEGPSPAEAATRYLGQKFEGYRFIIRGADDGPRWMMGLALPNELSEVLERLRARAESEGLLDEEGRPYSGGGSVWLAWGLGEMEADIEAARIVASLHGVRDELYKLYADRRDELAGRRSLPEGLTPAGAAAKYLSPYIGPERLAPYRLAVEYSLKRGDGYYRPGPFLMAGRDVSDGSGLGARIPGRSAYGPADVRRMLTARALGSGLRNERGEVYGGEDAAYLPWDMSEESPERLAADCAANLRCLEDAALRFYAEHQAEASQWTALPESPDIAAEKYLEPYVTAARGYLWRVELQKWWNSPMRKVFRFLIARIHGETRWLVGQQPRRDARGMWEILATNAERWGLVNEDGSPYSGGDVVYMAVSFDICARDGRDRDHR